MEETLWLLRIEQSPKQGLAHIDTNDIEAIFAGILSSSYSKSEKRGNEWRGEEDRVRD